MKDRIVMLEAVSRSAPPTPIRKGVNAAAGRQANRSPSKVQEVLAALSLAESTSSRTGHSIPDPALHQRKNSKMHELEMDQNNVVFHTRRCSTAVGVTPSDPSAIVDLFQEVEYIGSAAMLEASEDGSTTGEGEESTSGHVSSFFVTSTTTGVAPSSGTDHATSLHSPTRDAHKAAAGGAGGAGGTGGQEKQQQNYLNNKEHNGAAQKLWGESKNQPSTPMSPLLPREKGKEKTEQREANGSGSAVSKPDFRFAAPLSSQIVEGKLLPLHGLTTSSAGAPKTAEDDEKEGAAGGKGKEETRQIAGKVEGRRRPSFGQIRRSEGAWQIAAESPQVSVSGKPPAPTDFLPVPPMLKSNSVSMSESGQEAPLRRNTSMGSFQKGMGESLTGRMRKQLDIPRGPKEDIDTNIPLEQIQDMKYLAQGAMCVAYTAKLNGKVVVLKTPLPNTNHVEIAANDLEVEMLLLKELNHDNVVSLLGAGFLPDRRRFVALEYLSKGTLSSLLKNRKTPIGMSKVLDLSLALCNALEYLHDVAVPGRIVCHRDLKPDNIGFDSDGTLKVIDFGLGKIIKRRFRVRAEKYQMTGGTGSLRYMAPEVADHQEYNEKGDVYSFSLIMWEMLEGQKPFLGLKRADFYTRVVDQGERPYLNPQWPLHIRNLLESCWRTNLDERLSFREVAGILKVCAEEENRRSFTEEKRKSVLSTRSRIWTTTGTKPDLEEIADDPQYKPKFKISTFFTGNQRSGGLHQSMVRTVRKLGSVKGLMDPRRPNPNKT